MAENPKPPGLTKTRIFIVLFFGLAILLSITTILGTWEEQREGVVDPSVGNDPSAAATPAAAAPSASTAAAPAASN